MPVDPTFPEARRTALLRQCAAKTVLTTPSRRALPSPAGVAVWAVDDETAGPEAEEKPLPPLQGADDLAYGAGRACRIGPERS